MQCMPFNDGTNGIHFLGIVASEGLLIARIYGFSGNNNTCLIALLSLGSAILVTAVVLSAAPINLDISSASPPCVLEGHRSSALAYGLLAFFEIVLMSTTALLRYRYYLGSHSTLIRIIYRDGLFYIICIMMISTANVLVIAVMPLTYSDMLEVPQVVAHSVLASRILFNLPTKNVPVFPTYQSTTSTEMLSRPHELDAMSGCGETAGGADHNQV